MTEHNKIDTLRLTVEGFLASDNTEVVSCAKITKEILTILEQVIKERYWLVEKEESCPSEESADKCRKILNSGGVGDCIACWTFAAEQAAKQR